MDIFSWVQTGTRVEGRAGTNRLGERGTLSSEPGGWFVRALEGSVHRFTHAGPYTREQLVKVWQPVLTGGSSTDDICAEILDELRKSGVAGVSFLDLEKRFDDRAVWDATRRLEREGRAVWMFGGNEKPDALALSSAQREFDEARGETAHLRSVLAEERRLAGEIAIQNAALKEMLGAQALASIGAAVEAAQPPAET